MGGYGSGRYGGGPTAESAFRIDIDALRRRGWSRRAYQLAYASQRETRFDRALRRARKLRLRLGGDPAHDEYPEKPPRMRRATYNRLMDRLVAADGVADER